MKLLLLVLISTQIYLCIVRRFFLVPLAVSTTFHQAYEYIHGFVPHSWERNVLWQISALRDRAMWSVTCYLLTLLFEHQGRLTL